METQGRGATAKVILNWSDEALESMSNEYREMCDSQNMLYSMACLLMNDVTIDE